MLPREGHRPGDDAVVGNHQNAIAKSGHRSLNRCFRLVRCDGGPLIRLAPGTGVSPSRPSALARDLGIWRTGIVGTFRRQESCAAAVWVPCRERDMLGSVAGLRAFGPIRGLLPVKHRVSRMVARTAPGRQLQSPTPGSGRQPARVFRNVMLLSVTKWLYGKSNGVLAEGVVPSAHTCRQGGSVQMAIAWSGQRFPVPGPGCHGVRKCASLLGIPQEWRCLRVFP